MSMCSLFLDFIRRNAKSFLFEMNKFNRDGIQPNECQFFDTSQEMFRPVLLTVRTFRHRNLRTSMSDDKRLRQRDAY